MKSLRVLLLVTFLIGPLASNAKGPLDPIQTYGGGYDGRTLVCTDGTFSLDLNFGAQISAPGRGWSYAKSYILTGFGVYGPRLSGQNFIGMAKVSGHNTRVESGDRISAYLPELKAKLSLLDINYSIYTNLGVHGTLELESGKVFKLDCE